jgi:tartrate-resistant acid phosphatase type 5
MLYYWLIFACLTIGNDGIEFVAYGDWGQRNAGLYDTVNMVERLFPDRDFSILLGDNFYSLGVKSVADIRFQTMFSDIVNREDKLHYVVLGNHDHMGNVDAQIQYHHEFDSNWYMPERYYFQHLTDGNLSLCMLFLDTETFDETQAKWVDATLQNPECADPDSWIIVNGHHPIYSAGLYPDNVVLKDRLLPILHKNNVDVYLCGHEHLHEVFDDGKILSVVSGAVAQTRDAINFKEHEYLKWGLSGIHVTGFIHVDVQWNRLQLEIVSSTTSDKFVEIDIPHRGQQRLPPVVRSDWTNRGDALSTLFSHSIVAIVLGLMQ